MGQPVVHFEIECRNGDQAREFYSQMFDWSINVIPHNPPNTVLSIKIQTVPGLGARFVVPEVPSSTYRGKRRDEGHAGQVTVFVQVPDVEAALARAEKLGATRMQGPDPMGPGMLFGEFPDPEGHLIGVVSGAYDG